MDEVVEALEKYQGLVPLVYDIEIMCLVEARPQDMQYAVYLKREADKVIAELKRQIEFLKITTSSCKECNKCADGMGKVFNKELDPLKDRLRHSKYKRCLAMAEACMHKRWRTDDGFDYARSHRHMKKWLEIAEQFKPNNSTAQ